MQKKNCTLLGLFFFTFVCGKFDVKFHYKPLEYFNKKHKAKGFEKIGKYDIA